MRLPFHLAALVLFVVLLYKGEVRRAAKVKNDIAIPPWVSFLRDHNMIKHGKVNLPLDKLCDPNAQPQIDNLCGLMRDLALNVHMLESSTFCAHKMCGTNNAEFDPSTGLCRCGWSFLDKMHESRLWPGKHCDKNIACGYPLEPHWDPAINSCTCTLQAVHHLKPEPFRFEPNVLKNAYYGHSKDKMKPITLNQYLQKVRQQLDLIGKENDKHLLLIRQALEKMPTNRSLTTEGTTYSIPLPTHIPPPNVNVTDNLIQQSLLRQPQHTATVASVVPKFANGIITFLIQLDGPVSETLSLDARDTFPCGSIGANAKVQPRLLLELKNVKNGTKQTALPDCTIVAANLYTPGLINWWVQKQDGSIYGLLSDTKLRDIDQLDTHQPAAIALRTTKTGQAMKREIDADATTQMIQRRQIFRAPCSGSCPFYHMERVQGSDGYCGCMFKDPKHPINALAARGIKSPSPHSATMTQAACAAMKCIDNDGNPATFNPFNLTCWCVSPTFVEANKSLSTDGM